MQITPISVEEAKELVDKGAVIIDIRSKREFDACHIEGSHQDGKSEGGSDPLANCKGKVVIFTCITGVRTNMMAKSLAKRAEAAGCEACHILKGGYQAWKKAGHPTVEPEESSSSATTGGPSPSIQRQVMFVAGFICALGALLALLVHPWWAGLPLLMGCGLMFASLTGFCGIAKILMCMPWNRNAACCPCSSDSGGGCCSKEDDAAKSASKDSDGCCCSKEDEAAKSASKDSDGCCCSKEGKAAKTQAV